MYFTEQPYTAYDPAIQEQYPSLRLTLPNSLYDPKIASERLGHSKVGITLDLYSHVLPGMQEDAASRVDDALRLAIQKRKSQSIR